MLKFAKKSVYILLVAVMILSAAGCKSFDQQPISTTAENPTEVRVPETTQPDSAEIYANILSGTGTFFSHDYQKDLSISEYLAAFAAATGTQPTIAQYTILDMDADAVPELLLRIVVNDYSDYGTIVLRTQNHYTEGYTFAYRQLFDLKADGSFSLSGSESGSGYATLQFGENTWKYVEIPDSNQDAKESAEWVAYAQTTIPTETDTVKAIEEILTSFTTVYLSGDHDAMESYMVDNYQHEEIPYPYDGTTAVLAPINGIEVFAERLNETGMCAASVPFKKSASDDYYLYLTIELIQMDNALKVQFYGLEG